ncbi:Phosphatidylinositol:ceramide phosphoinositol transferase (IPC synthase) [Yamadazyma tenuis]|uniref:PAP2-domain-containing protein n=1 Tax=Candida tenuis (strain ATCC 10573 / BCRC 21748 / CBS 615 / JCM 9827 / NBRC 10315 / NRRL Y-1498 / VKM Y-70) TaxID=590646 RepID=G3B6G0_CANTC|nr:PAP2-domain-containing protein [Yamadazyma tenuis ATCC 10573]EGV63457.1 PAP2-domain-containing protein [Yamadazyma tenuis ATCC 10573]WEJ96714.1 Phosphatidylinositol:ceramide phosphoinositol transferase (IPC synthase) [Yamadazyma tenuis]
MSLLRSKIVQKPYQLFHYYFLSEQAPDSSLANLSFETDISITINKFKNHRWKRNEIAHYGFLSSVILFVFFIFPASFLIKLPILSVFGLCFLVPLTSQFFLHALPVFSWLALFFTCGKIPEEWKPAISVKFLPAMETILYGDNLSNVLATITTPTLDILAWLPYGLVHFVFPFVVAALIFVFGPPTALNSFGFAFGYLNLVGVLIQICLPAAAPWYKNLYGLQPANYSMSGSPGGLGRIDDILGFDMYTTAFSNSPMIFGAFPSLHSACAIMDVLFLSWLFPSLTVAWWGYGCWLWWSTMYLTHHYFFDLTSGALLSISVFTYTKYVHLPVMDRTKFCRWSYTEIPKVNINQMNPLTFNFNNDYVYNDLENQQPDILLSNPYQQSSSSSSGQPQSSLGIELENYSRSRQSSKVFLPQASGLPTIEDEETSSFDNSATTSVFDEVEQLSTIHFNTSLEDYDKRKPKKH